MKKYMIFCYLFLDITPLDSFIIKFQAKKWSRYCFYYTSYSLSMPPEKAIFQHKISPIDSFSLDRAFNEIPATSLSTPSLSQIMEYYVMFSLDRTSCFYSVICSAFSIPMDRTSFFIFYGINILISLECTSFFYFVLWNVLMPLDCTSL